MRAGRPRSWRERGPLARIWSILGEWIGECGRAARGPFQGAKPLGRFSGSFARRGEAAASSMTREEPSDAAGSRPHDRGPWGRTTVSSRGSFRRWNVSRSQKFLLGCSATARSRRGTATCRSSWPTSRWRAGPPLAPRVQGGGDRGGRRLTAAQAHHGDARKTPCRKGDIPELEKGDTSIRVDTSCRGVDISACSPYVSPNGPSTGFLHDPKRRRVVARQP